MSRVLALSPVAPPDSRVAQAVAALRSGGIVALPTETFYGLAADCTDVEALKRVNRLKNKPAGSPILLLLSGMGQIEFAAAGLPDSFESLARRFWPGPLTLIVPAAERIPDVVCGSGRTVAVRVPGLKLPRALADGLGRPVSGVSANLHGSPACRTASEVVRSFPEGLELILDGGTSPGAAPSTIVDLSTTPACIRREGLVPRSALEPFIDLGASSV